MQVQPALVQAVSKQTHNTEKEQNVPNPYFDLKSLVEGIEELLHR
jgi:hypothetical protein